MKKYLLLTLAFCLSISCSTNDEPSQSDTTGNIIINVTENGTSAGAGISLFTIPETQNVTTDNTGKASFTNVEYNNYDVYAYKEGIGSGSRQVNLNQQDKNVNIALVEANPLAPSVTILTPASEATTEYEEEIVFTAELIDNSPLGGIMSYTWESNLDGIFNSGTTDSDGIITYVSGSSSISIGFHTITLSVTNSLGLVTTQFINLSVNPSYFFNLAFDVKISENQPFAYVVSSSSIKIYNYESNLEIASLPIKFVQNIHVGDNGFGEELYVTANNVFYIYDSISFELKETIILPENTNSITSNQNGILFFSFVHPADFRLQTFNRGTLTFVDGKDDISSSQIRVIPNSNKIIAIEQNTTSRQMMFYEVDNEGYFIEEEEGPGDYDGPINAYLFFSMSPNGFLVTTFDGDIYTADEEMNYIDSISQNNENFTNFSFPNTGSFFYGAVVMEKALKICDQTDFTVQGEIGTVGYTFAQFYKNNKIITVQSHQPTDFSNHYIALSYRFDVIDLD